MRRGIAFVSLAILLACQPPLDQPSTTQGSIRLEAQLPPPKTSFTVMDAGLNRIATASVEITGYGITSPLKSGPFPVNVVGGIPTLNATFTGVPNGKNRVIWIRAQDSRGFELPGISVGGVFDLPTSGSVSLNRQTTAAARLYLDLLRLSANSDTKSLAALMANTTGASLTNLVQNALTNLGLADPDQLNIQEMARAVADANQGRPPSSFFNDPPKLPAPSINMKANFASIPVTVNAPMGSYRLAYSDRLSAPINLVAPATGLANDSRTIAGAYPAPFHALTFEKINLENEVVSRLVRHLPLPLGGAVPVRALTVMPEQAPVGATVTVAVHDDPGFDGIPPDGPYFGTAPGQVRMQDTNMAVSKWSDRSVQFKLPNTLVSSGANDLIAVISQNKAVTGEILGLFRILPGPPVIRKVVQSGGTIVIQGDNFSENSDDNVVTYTPANSAEQSPTATPIGTFPVGMLSFPGTLQRGDTFRVSIGGVLSNLFALNWIPRNSLNTSRYDFGTVALNGSVYAIGGLTSGSTAGVGITSVEQFNPAGNSWSPLPNADDAPGSLSGNSISAVAIDTNSSDTATEMKALVYGGTELYLFDPSAPSGNRWSGQVGTTSLRRGVAIAALNKGTVGNLESWRAYLIGGSIGGTATQTCTAFDVSGATFESVADLSAPRYGMAAVVHGGKIYAIGGFNASNSAVSTMEAYDPATDSWTTLASMPTARGEVQAAVVGNKIYVTGGLSGTTLQDRMEVYDITANSWSTASPMGGSRRNHGMAAVGNKIYAFGGRSASNSMTSAGSVFNSCEEFDTGAL